MTFDSGILLLLFLAVQRLAELWWSARNEALLRAGGGIEHRGIDFPLMIALQTAWMAGLWLLACDRAIVPIFLCMFVLLEVVRYWVLATLGRRWTIRVIVVPGEKLVARGPYRFLRHPNYAVVAGEIAIAPLALGLPIYALVFSILTALVMAGRLLTENAALGSLGPQTSRPG